MSDANSENRFVLNFGGRPARQVIEKYHTLIESQSQGFTYQDYTRRRKFEISDRLGSLF